MRKGIEFDVSSADLARLAAFVADRNSAQKHVWRAFYHPDDCGRFGRGRDHATDQQIEAVGLALAGEVYAGWGRRSAARQDTTVADPGPGSGSDRSSGRANQIRPVG